MPAPTQAELSKFIGEYGLYRLGCSNCFRDDFDGVKELPSDWEGISEVQSLKEALTTYEDEEDGVPPDNYSVLDWQTHIGLCPECRD